MMKYIGINPLKHQAQLINVYVCIKTMVNIPFTSTKVEVANWLHQVQSKEGIWLQASLTTEEEGEAEGVEERQPVQI